MRLIPALASPIDLKDVGRYVVSDEWVMEQKLDGHRIMFVADESPLLLNRSGVPYSKKWPKALLDHKIPAGYVIDGELVGETFWAFDIVHVDGSLHGATLDERRKVLEATVPAGSPIRVVPQVRGKDEKARVLQKAATEGYEGVIFKRRTSKYEAGDRSASWLKAKFTVTVDVIVMAVRDDGHESAKLGLVEGDAIVEVGRCSLIGKPVVQPGDVVEVRYLYATDPARPRLYQPTLLKVRTDKYMHECDMAQLRFTNKSVMASA